MLRCYINLSILQIILVQKLSESCPRFEKSNAAHFLKYAFSHNRIDFRCMIDVAEIRAKHF